MSITTPTAFPYTGMAEHGTDITKDLLQDANDRVEHGTHEAELHAETGWTATGAQMKRQALAVCDVAVESADNLRGEIRAHPLLAVFTGIVVGVLLGRALR